MNFNLFVHNVASVVSAATAIGLSLFTFWSYRQNRNVAGITLSLTLFFVAVFNISHVIGVNLSDPLLSRNVLMFNLSIIWVVVFNTHCVLAVLGEDKKKIWILALVYFFGAVLTSFYLFYPETFLVDSVPKMYFPNYYEPGQYHWIMRLVFNGVIPAYFLLEMIRVYRKTADWIERNRLKYFLTALVVGYGIGSIPIFLIYDIPFDPAWGMLFVFFYGSLFVYGVVRYELLDIKMVAKKAFVYGLLVAVTSLFIALVNFSADWILRAYPSFPYWIVPFFSSVLAVVAGYVIWRKMREGDILKYEFITIVTHKFRSPLTRIKWAADRILESSEKMAPENKFNIDQIQNSASKLAELTGLLAGQGGESALNYQYRFEKINLSELAQETLASFGNQAKDKRLAYSFTIEPNLWAMGDESRVKFVMQAMIENAVVYSRAGGKFSVSLCGEDKKIVFKVEDGGIGIAREEKPFMFSKFFRGEKARLMDTEGFGISLSVCKAVISRHRGKIWAESKGRGEGSIFAFSIPSI